MLPTAPDRPASPSCSGATALSTSQQCAPKNSGALERNMASDFIDEFCNSFADQPSLGKLLTGIPHFLFSAVPRYVGEKIQRGYDRHAQSIAGQFCFWGGATFKGLGNICGGVLGVVNGTIDAGVAWVKNLAECSIRTILAGLSLAIDPAAARADLGFHDGFEDTDVSQRQKLLSFASSMFVPSVIKNAAQTPLPRHEAERLYKLYSLTEVSSPAEKMARQAYVTKTNFSQHPSTEKDPGKKISYSFQTTSDANKWTPAHREQIPSSILARRTEQPNNTGEILNLHIDTDNWGATVLVGDGWSSLHVGVFVNQDGKIVLVFPGSETCGNVKTIAAANLGIVDSAFQDAQKLVAAFVDKYPGRVELVGYSMGGALAQYAGISNDVEQITVFNSMGLHVSLRNELGSKITHAAVTHVNAGNDGLSQQVEHITPSAQVVGGRGHRYVIPGKYNHAGLRNAFTSYTNNSQEKREQEHRNITTQKPKVKAKTHRVGNRYTKSN
jgi:hypothetical protein